MDKKKIKMSKIDMKEIENAKLADEVINRFCFIATVPGELWFYKESDGLFHKHGDDLLGTELINQQRTPGDIENITKIVHHRTKIRLIMLAEKMGMRIFSIEIGPRLTPGIV